MAGEQGCRAAPAAPADISAALLPQQRRGADDPGRGRQRDGTRGGLLQYSDLGLACSRERQLGYVEQFRWRLADVLHTD